MGGNLWELEKQDIPILSLGQVSSGPHRICITFSRSLYLPSAHREGQNSNHFGGYEITLGKSRYCGTLGKKKRKMVSSVRKGRENFFQITPEKVIDKENHLLT